MRDEAKVFLIGAGPGDPELLTLKAFRLLQEADVILHDSLADMRIVNMARFGARRIDVGKRCGRHSYSQAEICNLLVREALAGHLVVRLKGGDPMIFGRATEEMQALRAYGIGFEVVPGITTASAAAARLQISLTQREAARSVHFITGHAAQGGLPPHDFTAMVKAGSTLAIYMGSQTIGGFAAHLIEAGAEINLPALAIENVSLPTERLTRGTLATLPKLLAAAAPVGPVLILLGEALNAAEEFPRPQNAFIFCGQRKAPGTSSAANIIPWFELAGQRHLYLKN